MYRLIDRLCVSMALRRGWTVLAKVNAMHQSHCRALSATTVTAFKKGRGTGDQGQSGLFSNERRWKDDDVFEALGTTDELNSIIGMCREATYADGLFDVSEALAQVQCCLQDVAAHLATPPTSSERKLERTRFDSSLVTDINEKIDDWGDRTPALKTFILPGGGETGALLQYARSVCRRAERRVVPLLRSEAIDGGALRYLNRLSDLLFVLGRYACMVQGKVELSYQKPESFQPTKSWKAKKLDQ